MHIRKIFKTSNFAAGTGFEKLKNFNPVTAAGTAQGKAKRAGGFSFSVACVDMKTAKLIHHTILSPLMMTQDGFAPSVSGCSLKITISASFPGRIEPTRSSISQILAAFMVIARSASAVSIPFAAQSAAQRGRYSMGVSGWSVITAVRTPAFERTPAVWNVMFFSSTFPRLHRDGPDTTLIFSSFM